jgi:hypothetical protein
MSKKTFIYCTFQKEGYHRFPGADVDPNYATGDEYDVSHLALRHMHYFNFKVWVQVTHQNRQIEFIQLRRWIERLYSTGSLELDYKSCEMLCDDLYEKLSERYPGMEIRIDVSEEGINGAYTEYQPS